MSSELAFFSSFVGFFYLFKESLWKFLELQSRSIRRYKRTKFQRFLHSCPRNFLRSVIETFYKFWLEILKVIKLWLRKTFSATEKISLRNLAVEN